MGSGVFKKSNRLSWYQRLRKFWRYQHWDRDTSRGDSQRVSRNSRVSRDDILLGSNSHVLMEAAVYTVGVRVMLCNLLRLKRVQDHHSIRSTLRIAGTSGRHSLDDNVPINRLLKRSQHQKQVPAHQAVNYHVGTPASSTLSEDSKTNTDTSDRHASYAD